MSLQQFNFYPTLTPVRLASTSNVAGTYTNGLSNNGVGAQLIVAASSLTIDSVLVNVGDRILLQTQTNTNEQGIYIVLSIGSTVVLQRSDDQQNIEQLKAGQSVAVGAGSTHAGNFYTLVEPLPAHLGIDALVFNADPSAGGVAFSGGPSTANALPVFSDTAGNIKAATTTTTLSQPLTVAGTITSSTGDIVSGSSGDAGNFVSFPATAANGTFIFEALNAGGAFNTTIRNSTMGQSTVYSIPDIGAATGGIVVSTDARRLKAVDEAAAAGGAAAQSFTDAFCTATSVVIGNWVTQANAASVLKIVPGNGSFVVTSSADAGVGTFSYIILK